MCTSRIAYDLHNKFCRHYAKDRIKAGGLLDLMFLKKVFTDTLNHVCSKPVGGGKKNCAYIKKNCACDKNGVCASDIECVFQYTVCPESQSSRGNNYRKNNDNQNKSK